MFLFVCHPLTWNLGTRFERVSLISRWTGADGLVVEGVADGVDAAGTLAGVETLLPDAGQVGRALAVDEALGVAVGRSAEVALLTAAHWARSLKFTNGVRSTGVRITGLRWCFGLDHYSCKIIKVINLLHFYATKKANLLFL